MKIIYKLTMGFLIVSLSVLVVAYFSLSAANSTSKVEAGKIELVIEKVHVPQAINEGLTLVKEKAMKHNINLKVELDPELEFVEVDKLRLKQILFNLLSNAVKFSKPEGGTVTVKTRKEGDMAQISAGITKKYGGTGLGLSISKKLVELHGGTIMAESEFGKGSTFTFCCR